MKSVVLNQLKKYDWQLIAILLVASFFHFSLLNVRPPHHDEGVFGFFVDGIRDNGFYRYDPTNYHGPLHYYVLFFFQTLFGRNIWALRLPDALISILTVYWVTKFSPFLGRRISLISALAVALSPGFIYFGGFAFQEAFLVFYTILVLWGILGLCFHGTKKYLWAIGIGFTLMFLTKETYLIHIGCFIIAWFCLLFFEKFSPSAPFTMAKQSWTTKDLMWVVITFFVLVVFFYSGNFFNLDGLRGLLQTYTAWYKTGVKGSGHDKPFWYWFGLFSRYEQIALLGFVMSIRYLRTNSSKWVRYIVIFGIGVFLAYSLIPYKTTWCIINLLWPFYFVFGDTINYFLETKNKHLGREITFWLFVISGIISCKLNYIDNTNEKEPYVYVQTYNEYKKFTDTLLKLTKQDPSKYQATGHIILDDQWPLSWILGDFTRIGYYGKDISPNNYDADFLVAEGRRVQEIEEKLLEKYFTGSFRLHSAQTPSTFYLNYETFKNLFSGRDPDFVPLKPNQGLLAAYYSNPQWKGTPVLKKQIGKIDFYLDEGSQSLKPPFGIELTGEINIPSQETTLILSTDDGGYLEIDGQRIIEDLGSHGEHAQTGIIRNLQGWRKIKIGCYNIWGYFVVRLRWRDISGNEVYVPVSALRFEEGMLKQ